VVVHKVARERDVGQAGAGGGVSAARSSQSPSVFEEAAMIRKLKSGKYRLYSRKKDPRTGKRRNLGTFASLAAAKRHERAIQYFKRA
jgi:hypothetical protein